MEAGARAQAGTGRPGADRQSVDLRAVRRVEGFVEACAGGLRGWAWHPGDPDRDPLLTIRSPDGQEHHFAARDSDLEGAKDAILARPRAFHVPAAAIARLPGQLRVFGEDGRDLLGGPLDPGAPQRLAAQAAHALAQRFPTSSPRPSARRPQAAAMPAAIPADTPRPAIAVGAVMRPRGVNVVIPVHGGAAETLACLESVFANTGASARVIVVDDCTPEPRLARTLDDLAGSRRIRLIRHA